MEYNSVFSEKEKDRAFARMSVQFRLRVWSNETVENPWTGINREVPDILEVTRGRDNKWVSPSVPSMSKPVPTKIVEEFWKAAGN